MLGRLFPKQVDNASYRGHWLAIWLLVPIVLMKLAQNTASLVMSRNILTTVDRVPLDNYSAAAADTVIMMFALLSVYGLVIHLVAAVALIRYRALIPLMYLALLLVQVGSRAVLMLNPIARSDAPSGGLSINLVVLAITLIGFVLSLWPKREQAERTDSALI
jgi:hypothetical protein